MKISSWNNPEVKRLNKLLTKRRARTQQQLFVVEGLQENQYALHHGFQPKSFYIQEDLFQNRIALPSQIPQFQLSDSLYEKLAYRGGTEGLLGLYEMREKSISFSQSQLILILEGLEKPGNLGAIIRSSLAFGVEGIILTGNAIDVYNPNVIRSSVGTVFTIPIDKMSNEQCYDAIQNAHYTLYGTDMHKAHIELENVFFGSKNALLFGTEHSGLSDFWKDKIEVNYLIPMQSNLDSLNLSNAVAISLYQYRVQKKPIARQ